MRKTTNVKPVKRVLIKNKIINLNNYILENSWDSKDFTSLSALLSNWDDEEELNIIAKYTGSKNSINFRFSIGEFQFCCGMKEIGELSSRVLIEKDMDEIFMHLFKQYKNKTFIITTISSQKEWEAYLHKTKLFQAVKSFVNDTRNTITLWASTN